MPRYFVRDTWYDAASERYPDGKDHSIVFESNSLREALEYIDFQGYNTDRYKVYERKFAEGDGSGI